MKVVGLVSGGKDSCYNLMRCIDEGHEVVCLANLRPPSGTQELDSYMYQTVGSGALDYYGEACGLPLYRRTIVGRPVDMGMDYSKTESDEVEDLYELLSEVLKHHPDVEAVSAGAIFSTYQKLRVENVCRRLALTSLSYLWQREQHKLLNEMLERGINAIIIKVAAMGLEPRKHLGMTLAQIAPIVERLHAEHGINECGEGGEYETLVLDCPLFKKRIVIDKSETVIHSDDAFAPVGYLRIDECHLEEK